ncbi:MAG: 30S ribosomal protein S1, partial [Chloroflexi bacterium]|nr:30S ribosomal protein S1 [Chloroflexota bacterium]
MHDTIFEAEDESELDFAALLEASFKNETIEKGAMLTGTVLAIDNQGMIVDVGLKRDGVVPRSDMEAMGDIPEYELGQDIAVVVITPEDRDGNLLVSVKQARAYTFWEEAREQMESGESFLGQVIDANKGGLIVPFGELRGFVPASHVGNLPRGLSDPEREDHLHQLVGKQIELRVIEVTPARRRLVFSQREAERQRRAVAKERLLQELQEGDIVKGRVRSIRDFGAFVDLGGADGLVHVSEIAWHRVRHPSEMLNVGDEVETYVLQVDPESKRIGLSLKRLTANPWDELEKTHHVGQLVEGTVTRVVSFGAFVELQNGIEALLHLSEIADPPPETPDLFVQAGDTLLARIFNLAPDRQRIGLSLRDVEQHVVAAG